jgi:putative ABC transport system permease protein
MPTLIQDLRQTVRKLAAQPGFTLAIVASLALGIGANSAVFSFVNAVLLKPLPVPRPERLVALYTTRPSADTPGSFSYPDYLDYRDHNGVFSDLFGHSGVALSLNDGERPVLVWGEMVTANYFTGLGLEAARGRIFRPDEAAAPGAGAVAVIGYDFWQRQLGGDPSVVGRTLHLNGQGVTVVGVAPKGFAGTQLLGFAPEVWVPLALQPLLEPAQSGRLEQRDAHWLELRGRLAPGVTMAQAEEAMNALARRLAEQRPQAGEAVRIHLLPGKTKTEPFVTAALAGKVGVVTGVLLGFMGLVLAIACSNVATLLLARSGAHSREMAVRTALGAGRWRVVRQVLTEGFLLALLGAGVGLLLAAWLSDLATALDPRLDFPIDYGIGLDRRVLAYTGALMLLTGLLFALAPALRAAGSDPADALKGRGAVARHRGRAFAPRNLLVVSQVAFCLVLLVIAGLFLHSLGIARAVDPGFERDHLLLGSVDLGLGGYDAEQGRRFYRQVVDEVGALPGVRSASLASPLPLDAYTSAVRVVPPAAASPEEAAGWSVFTSFVAPGYFATLGTPLLRGRGFGDGDGPGAPDVAVLNHTLAERLWPGEEAVGRRFRLGSADGEEVEVVGVAADGKYLTLGEDPRPYVFFPLTQSYQPRVTILARTEGDARSEIAAVRDAVARLDPALAVFGVKTMEGFLDRSLAGPRSLAVLTGLFALLALIQAAVGIYGLMSYFASQRTHEIGIRMALGAKRSDVLGLVVRQGLARAAAGLLIGLAGALALGRVMASVLYGTSGHDPVVLTTLSAALAAIAFVACYLPARRASRADPTAALRHG